MSAKNCSNYCCVCLFDIDFSSDELHKIKRDTMKLRSYYSEILKAICEMKTLGCASFWHSEVQYKFRDDAEDNTFVSYLSEDIDSLFEL